MSEYIPTTEELDGAELCEDPSLPRLDSRPLGFQVTPGKLPQFVPGKLKNRGATSQAELWEKTRILKDSIVAKLVSIDRFDHATPLAKCHTEDSFRVCNGCQKATLFSNRCEIHCCPMCAPRLARERRESVEWWAQRIDQPKHVVLTRRNSAALTAGDVRTFKRNFSRLRRRKFARNWRGGFWRLEVTNEKRGWHLHLHALVDCAWIDSGKLASEWADCIGQEFSIVKVKDVHCRDYLAEVTKYTVKGTQLASWSPAEIAMFLDAFSGQKTFGVFGSLHGKRTQWREWIDSLQARQSACECGCAEFQILSPNELAWQILRRESEAAGRRTHAPPQEDQPHLPGALLYDPAEAIR